jgi:hypothetical protein
MKKSILGALLGAAMAVTSYGQGHILISNYVTPPYNQVVWNSSPSSAPAGQADKAVADFSLTFQIFYGAGTITDASALTPGVTFNLSSTGGSTGYDPGAGHGPGGYFINVVQTLPNWSAGDTYTFMYGVAAGQGNYSGQSVLWQESAQINSASAGPLNAATVPGLVVSVPEPATFALFGLGSLGLLFFRRRKVA